MKKIISIILCTMLFVCAMSTCVFSLNYYVGDGDITAPVTDGKVEEGEYTWTSGRFDPKVAIPGKVNIVVMPQMNINSQFYMSYDSDYIYMAYEEYNSTSTLVWFRVNPCVSFEKTEGQIDFYVNFSKGTGASGSGDPAASLVRVYASAEQRNDVSTSDYLAALKCGWNDDGKANTNTVEIKIKRDALEKYAGGEFDQIGFRGLIQGSGDGSKGEVYFADENSDFKAYGGWGRYGYHIINLNTNGENPATAPSSVSVDGVVNDGEYSWVSDAFDRNENIGNEISVITKHSDSEKLTSQFFMNYDGEYIYLAYRERGGYATEVSLDINPSLAKSQILIPISYTRSNDVSSNTGVDILSSITPRIYSQNGDYTEDTSLMFVIAAQGSWRDDGKRNNNTIELKISVAALEEYVGTDITQIGFRAIVTSDGEAVYCSALSPVAPLDVHTDKKYHVFELNAENDVTEKIFAVSADHQHTFDKWISYSETHHSAICSECGILEYDFHSWNDGDASSEEGIISFECVLCGAAAQDTLPETAPAIDVEPEDKGDTDREATETQKTEILVDKKGCGASFAVVGVTLVATMGVCTIFISKRK